MKGLKFVTNQKGEKTGVIVPMETFQAIQRELEYGIPEWHKSIVNQRLKEESNPGISWEDVKKRLKGNL